MKAIYPALALVLVLAACSSSPPPAPTPVPTPTVRPTPPTIVPARPVGDWRDRPLSAGDWSWRREGGRSIASYGDGRFVRFSLSCDLASRQVTLRSAMLNTSYLEVTTTDARRVVQVTFDEAIIPATSKAVLDPRDPVLDAMAFSRGRFMIGSVQGNDIMPSHPEISRVIEDCR